MAVLQQPIDGELDKQIKILAIQQGMTKRQLVTKALEMYLDAHAQPGMVNVGREKEDTNE